MSEFRNDSLRGYTTIVHRHTDAEGNIIAEQIDNELKQVVDRTILLEQIPHRTMGLDVCLEKKNLITGSVELLKLMEIDIRDSIEKENQFKIDYNSGKLYTHYDLEGLNLKIDYWGTGSVLLHASRIYSYLDAERDIFITLEELIENIRNMTDVAYITDILRQIEESKTSDVTGIQYQEFKDRVNNIERDLKKNKEDTLLIGNDVFDIKENMTEIVETVEDVDIRMSVLESNYLNPSLVLESDIDRILGELV